MHVLSDTDFKAAITNHPKAITSVRQFATDHFKKASTKTESGNDETETESGNDTPAEKSVAELYTDFINAAFAGNVSKFYDWLASDNAEQLNAAITNAKRKAQPELPKLKSLAS